MDKLKSIFNKEEIKSRLPYALLAGFTSSFMFFFFGVLEIFAGNRDEFMFSVRDFVGYIVIIALSVAIVISALILFLPKTVSLAVFGVMVWITLMGYVQVLFLNGSGSLGGDTGQKESLALIIIDSVIWIVSGVFIVAGALIMQKKDVLKKIYIIGIIALLVMMTAGCASQIGEITRERQDTVREDDTQSESLTDTQTDAVTDAATDAETTAEVTDEITTEAETTGAAETEPETTEAETTEAVTTAPVTTAPVTTAPVTTAEPIDPDDYSSAYLTKQGINQVSSGKNIVIFIIDRFDVSYYETAVKRRPDMFDGLDGFTYFSDNITLYSRTWPAVPTMITGVDNDFSASPEVYFEKAYTGSQFLKDLKNNNYRIKLYTQKYYCYREGTPLVGVADNISVASGYTISSTKALVGGLLSLSAYRYAPNAFKDSINISSASFKGIVQMRGGAPLFEIDDPDTCGQILDNGLSFDSEGNSYIFIHLNGCHSPSNMDANAKRVEAASSDDQLRGCFKMIYFYLEEMKRLGVYDDSTIVITGDHPRARNDTIIPEQPRLTSLFVKPAGSRGALKYSKAQVSQENLIPTLIKSAGIKTDHDYGRSYFEIPENENTVRYHKFELTGEPCQIVTFKITGKGDDFKNWKVDSTKDVVSFYK